MSRNNTTNYESILPLKGVGGAVAVLISGGVDSAVVVHLLCEAGLKPDLHYIKIGMDGEDSSCTAEEDIELSQATARKYGLKLEVTDLQKEYWEQVVGYTIERIKLGLTPNPDVMCNRLIKFGAFEQKVGCHYDCIGTINSAGSINEDNPNHSWQMMEADGSRYLYNIGAKKYAKHYGSSLSLTDEPTPIDVVNSDNGLILGAEANRQWALVCNERLNASQAAIDQMTGLKTIDYSSLTINHSIYNAAGQRLSKPQKGLNIIGGRKALIR